MLGRTIGNMGLFHLDRYMSTFSEITSQSESTEIRPDWKPPFLSNEEFTQLMLEVSCQRFLTFTLGYFFDLDYKEQCGF